MCQNFGLIVDVIDCDWRGPADPAQIEAILRADTGRQIKAVLATHNETATGVRSDLASIREAIDHAGSDALFFVDGVSSIASMDFQMDEWGIDAADRLSAADVASGAFDCCASEKAKRWEMRLNDFS